MPKLPTVIDAPEISIDMLAVLTAADLVKLAGDPSVVVEIEEFALDAQHLAARRSAMLRQPMRVLAAAADDGGPVATGLIELRDKVEALDPARFDFEPGWFSRLFGYLPFIGSPIKRYFARYESAEAQIDAILQSLEVSQRQIKADAETMTNDRTVTRQVTQILENRVTFAKALDAALVANLAKVSDDKTRQFIEEQLLFKLRQRSLDLGTQLNIAQQTVMATDVLIENQKELSKGITRASTQTVRALELAVTTALVLANQKIALTKIKALSDTTSNLLVGNASRLRTQGAEIQKQASSSTLDLEKLKTAFADVIAALDEVGSFRRNALGQMAQQILELDRIAVQGEAKIQEFERATKADIDAIEHKA